jgi:hypothetical protein
MRYLEETTRRNSAGDTSGALLMRIRRYFGDAAPQLEQGDVAHLSRLIDYHFETEGDLDRHGGFVDDDEAWYAEREAKERREAAQAWGDE